MCGMNYHRRQSEDESEDTYEPKPKRGRPTGGKKGPKESKVRFLLMNTKYKVLSSKTPFCNRFSKGRYIFLVLLHWDVFNL